MFDIWGEAVNVAATVESAAKAGRVTVSQTTLELTHGFFDATPRGKVEYRKTEVPLFEIDRLRPEFSDDGVTPNAAFRERYRDLFLPTAAPASIAPPPRFMDE